MPRNIVICCDGTGKNMEKESPKFWTNVAKLRQSITDPDRQYVKYIPGIGTRGTLEWIFGPPFGYGMEKNIKEAYKHICAHYRPHKDHIYLFGFSRGAYTVRSLAGFVRAVGLLLNECTDELIERAYAYYWWGENIDDDGPLKSYLTSLKLLPEPHEDKRVQIYFMGLWDSVASLGLWWSKNRFLPVNYHKVELPDHVSHAYQALALHELRPCFVPVFWSSKQPSQKMEQVWFPGAHTDIGGGYQNSALSDITLRWMEAKVHKADTSSRQLQVNITGMVRSVSSSPARFMPHNSFDVPDKPRESKYYDKLTPTRRLLFRDEFAGDSLAGVWDTIFLHGSTLAHWNNQDARQYRYRRAAINKELHSVDDRSVQFHCAQFDKYGSGFASD